MQAFIFYGLVCFIFLDFCTFTVCWKCVTRICLYRDGVGGKAKAYVWVRGGCTYFMDAPLYCRGLFVFSFHFYFHFHVLSYLHFCVHKLHYVFWLDVEIIGWGNKNVQWNSDQKPAWDTLQLKTEMIIHCYL